jgi:hypothetical protein
VDVRVEEALLVVALVVFGVAFLRTGTGAGSGAGVGAVSLGTGVGPGVVEAGGGSAARTPAGSAAQSASASALVLANFATSSDALPLWITRSSPKSECTSKARHE